MIELLFFIFLFGLVIGSFLNVVICRLATGEDLVKKRSHCPGCGRALRWFDLIPLISFFLRRARCRHCGGKISWQYPLVEAATGLLFVVAFNFVRPSVQVESFSLWLSYGYLLVVGCCLIVIFVYDLRHYIIPDVVLWPAVGVTLAYRVFKALAISPWSAAIGEFLPFALSALGAAVFFLLITLVTRGRGMGLGDAKLAFLMGLILGWPDILAALFLSFLGGAVVGVALIIAERKTMKSQIPFGPFMIIGAWLTVFWGSTIINFYVGNF